MATGQFVYNLEDYAGMGGLVSTNLTNKQIGLNKDMSSDEKINIFANVFASKDNGGGGLDISNVTKLGIQAPPGTRFYINTDTTTKNENENSVPTSIMVGRTGIYELEVPNMSIGDLHFEKPMKYVLDIDLSQNQINTGRAGMEAAKIQFDNAYNQLLPLYTTAVDTDSNKEFWEEYERIHDLYVQQYESARAIYVQGMAGVYREELGNSDLYNIIIDYKYDLVGEELS